MSLGLLIIGLAAGTASAAVGHYQFGLGPLGSLAAFVIAANGGVLLIALWRTGRK